MSEEDTMSTSTEVQTLVLDHVGLLAVYPINDDAIVSYLTPCCRASAKGSGDGVVCRACYVTVDERLGMGWMASDDEAWRSWGKRWLDAEPISNWAMVAKMVGAAKRAAVSA